MWQDEISGMNEAQSQYNPERGDQAEEHGQQALEVEHTHIEKAQQESGYQHQKAVMEHAPCCHKSENQENAAL